MELEYLIIYTNNGLPVYARCFADSCKTAIGNPTLFTAFLASLNQFAKYDPENIPDEMMLNDIPVKVNFNPDDGVNSINLKELQLLFFYSQLEDITISAGFNSEKYDRAEIVPIFKQFLEQVEEFLKSYEGTDWSYIETAKLLEFENKLLDEVVDPFFNRHGMKNKCALGENCPFRIAIYEGEEPTIYDRLKHMVQRYRDKNIFQKMKMMIFGSKYSLGR